MAKGAEAAHGCRRQTRRRHAHTVAEIHTCATGAMRRCSCTREEFTQAACRQRFAAETWPEVTGVSRSDDTPTWRDQATQVTGQSKLIARSSKPSYGVKARVVARSGWPVA